jgi:hypothetical protein
MLVLNLTQVMICNQMVLMVHHSQMHKQDDDKSQGVQYVIYHLNQLDPYVVITKAKWLVVHVYLKRKSNRFGFPMLSLTKDR